jgi:hypothetical protein
MPATNLRPSDIELPPDRLTANPEPDPVGSARNDNTRGVSLVSGLALLVAVGLMNVAMVKKYPTSCSAEDQLFGASIGVVMKLAGC